jgi:hypothetical protein
VCQGETRSFICISEGTKVNTDNNLKTKEAKYKFTTLDMIDKMLYSHASEIIKHLFYECYYAKILWDLLNLVFNIVPHYNVHHMYDTWLNQLGKKTEKTSLSQCMQFE